MAAVICVFVSSFFLSTNMAAPLSEDIQRLSFHNIRPLVFHGYIFPFIFIFSTWAYTWTAVYGLEEYYEAGLIAFAGIGLLQILTALFCMWSVHVRCTLTCSSVSVLQEFSRNLNLDLDF